jgi:hypothetical protein
LSRPANAKEKESLLHFLTTQREHYQTDKDEASNLIKIGNKDAPKYANQNELAAWTQVCRVILNLNETITAY